MDIKKFKERLENFVIYGKVDDITDDLFRSLISVIEYQNSRIQELENSVNYLEHCPKG